MEALNRVVEFGIDTEVGNSMESISFYLRKKDCFFGTEC